MSSREQTANHRSAETLSENKAAAVSVGRSRRRHAHRFAASVPLRSRLLRQRSGVPDRHHAVWVARKPMTVRAERHRTDLPATFEVEEYLAGLGIPHLHRVVLRTAGQAFAV